MGTQRGAAGSKEIASFSLDIPERRRQPPRDLLGQLATHRAAQHHDVMAQPQQRAQKGSGVRTRGEASIALMLGFGSGRVQPRQCSSNPVVNTPTIRLVDRECGPSARAILSAVRGVKGLRRPACRPRGVRDGRSKEASCCINL